MPQLSVYAMTKAAANMLGLAAGSLRAPLTDLAPENKKKLESLLKAAGAMKMVKARATIKK
jgi:4-hydroxy-tetrahydrodipicolinate synthase